MSKPQLIGPPRKTRGRGGDYRAGDVAFAARARYVVLEASRSPRPALRYPWRLLIGPITDETANALVAAGARAILWRWDGKRRRRV